TAPGVHPVADGHDGDRGAPPQVATVTAHGPGTQNRGRARSTDGYSSVTAPPAAVIFWRALSENACALTCRTTPPAAPAPSTLTGPPRRTAPAATRVSGSTAPPSGKSWASRSTFTTWYSIRNRLRKPLSLGSRMWRGIWPPSKAGETLCRAFVPLVPRPAVLPLEPSPRPTRVFLRFEPGAGRRWWILIVTSYSTSSTVTRCGTVWIMPRISGRSSLTTTSRIRFRPSERSVSRWFRLAPMADRTWVTFSRAISHPLPGPRPQQSGRGDILQ